MNKIRNFVYSELLIDVQWDTDLADATDFILILSSIFLRNNQKKNQSHQ